MTVSIPYDPDAITNAKRINALEMIGGPRADPFFGSNGHDVVWLRNRGEALCADEEQRNGRELRPGQQLVVENGRWRVETVPAEVVVQ